MLPVIRLAGWPAFIKKNKAQISGELKEISPPEEIVKTVFETLFDEEICFAVSVSSNTFISSEFLLSSIEYHIMILEDDLKRLKKHAFYQSNTYNQIYEKQLSAMEIEEFKNNQDKFIKRIHSADGRIYELKTQSFKANFEQSRSWLYNELMDK